MTRRPARTFVLAAGLALLGTVAVPWAGAATPAGEPVAPVNELDAVPSRVVPVATGVSLFIGAGTAQPAVEITSFNDFTANVSQPSPMLLTAVQQFYVQGGGAAYVLTVPSEDATAFTAALSSATATPGWDLLVIPALGSLSPPDWLTVATAMTSTASTANATALLDPPDATVTAAEQAGAGPLIALAQQLRGAVSAPANAVMLSSGLTGNGSTVPGAAVLAGLVVDTDAKEGVWATPGGPNAPVVGGLVPVLSVDDAIGGDLNVEGIDPWRVLPGYGTVFFGGRTLSLDPEERYINVQRTQSWITKSIDDALQAYVFAPNNAATWTAVSASISSFLTSVWEEGGLVGASAAAAFTVNVGLGSTMTPQDILDGLMLVSVEVALVFPAEMVALNFQQQM
jgi:phage tail sheath protein FI